MTQTGPLPGGCVLLAPGASCSPQVHPVGPGCILSAPGVGSILAPTLSQHPIGILESSTLCNI
jgi:hypothetical protein